MSEITYRVTYSEGEVEMVIVYARSINSGFSKAVKKAREPLGSGVEREIARVEFWHR